MKNVLDVTTPRVFVSSVYSGLEKERREIFQRCQERALAVFVAEETRKDLHPDRCEPLEIVDALLEEIRHSRSYICILAGNREGPDDHGSLIRVGTRFARSSYFEIELLQAAIHGKRVKFLVASDFAPGTGLRSLLNILEATFPKEAWVKCIARDKLAARVVDEIANNCRRSLSSWTPVHPIFLEHLFKARGHPTGTTRPALKFLNGQFDEGYKPDRELITYLLDQVNSTENYERKLAGLWMVVRELLASPPMLGSRDFLPLWNQALGLWAKTGAWYSLHGHIFLGSLAASDEQKRVRLRMREMGGFGEEDLSHPGVSLASALYSIAKKIREPRSRASLFDQALVELQTTLSENSTNDTALAVQGSIFFQKRQFWRAADVYEKVMKMREKNGNDAALGDAKAEYGFGLIFCGHPIKGRRYLQEGVTTLDKTGSPGFRVRARKKLAYANLILLNFSAYRELKEQARQIAVDHNLLDQL